MRITAEDFNYLAETQMQWAGYEWEVQADRFNTPDLSFQYQWAFWFESMPAMIMARTYLQQCEIEFQQTFDESLEQWVLLTDFSVEPYEVA